MHHLFSFSLRVSLTPSNFSPLSSSCASPKHWQSRRSPMVSSSPSPCVPTTCTAWWEKRLLRCMPSLPVCGSKPKKVASGPPSPTLCRGSPMSWCCYRESTILWSCLLMTRYEGPCLWSLVAVLVSGVWDFKRKHIMCKINGSSRERH